MGEDGESNISRDKLAKAWGCGGVHISTIRNANAVALYLSNNGERKQTMRLKYPPNMRLYRCSKGIARPKAVVLSGEDAQAEVQGYTTVYQVRYKTGDGCWHSRAVYAKSRMED